MADERHEIAAALGFASVADMDSHQQWLADQQRHAAAVRERVAAAHAAGSVVIDLRGLDDQPRGEWSGSPDPDDPDNFWIDDETNERVCARIGRRMPPRFLNE